MQPTVAQAGQFDRLDLLTVAIERLLQQQPLLLGDAPGFDDGSLRAGYPPHGQLDPQCPLTGAVVGQRPAEGTQVRPADLVYLKVYLPAQSRERYTYLPPTLGAKLARTRAQLQAKGATVRVIELDVPNHPYAGTGSVAAQWPISTVPASMARDVTLWVIK